MGTSGRAVLTEKLGVITRVARALTLRCGCQRPRLSCVLPDIQASLKIYQFKNVGLIEKENVRAKQNRSLGQIWLKGCHSAVDSLWDNNSQCLWSACGHPGQETKCLPLLSTLSAWRPTKWVSFPSLFHAGGSRLSGVKGLA